MFLEEFNKITGKRYLDDDKSRKLFSEVLENFLLKEIIQCTENVLKNPFFRDGCPDIVTPVWILKPSTLA